MTKLVAMSTPNAHTAVSKYHFSLKQSKGNSLVVQWLEPHAFTAKGPGSIPGWGTEILQAPWCG